MPIEHNGKKIKEIFHGDKPIKEVYHGDKKVWSKNQEESVPPYAMLHALKTATPIHVSSSNYSTAFEEKSLSTSGNTRTGFLSVLMADGGSLELKNGSTTVLTLTRSGNSYTCFSRSDKNNTGTSTVNVSSSHPFVPVCVHISSRANGYYLQIRANNSPGNSASINSSGFFAPTDSFVFNSGTMNDLCFGYQWSYSDYSSDWRYRNVGSFDGSAWFQQALNHSIGWDDFFGQPRQWGNLPASHQQVTGRSQGWRYSSPVTQKDYTYTAPEGIQYSEQFWLAGAYQDTVNGGGQGGQGGRSGNDHYNGDCLNAQGNSGGCSVMSGKGNDGSKGLNYYIQSRWHFRYSRTRTFPSTIHSIHVGRGSMYNCAAYWGNEERTGSDRKNAGGPGGAGGVYKPGVNTLYGGTTPAIPAVDNTQSKNSFYFSGYTDTSGKKWTQPYSIEDGISSHPLTWNYWGNEENYNEFHPQVPSMCHGVMLETFIPNEDASFDISDSYWAKHLPFYRPQRPVKFYSDHSGKRLIWPPEPTAKGKESEYKDIGAAGFGYPGEGGEGGAPGGIKQNGYPGEAGKSSYIDAGGTGCVVLYYEFEEPKVV